MKHKDIAPYTVYFQKPSGRYDNFGCFDIDQPFLQLRKTQQTFKVFVLGKSFMAKMSTGYILMVPV
jgi:hypothetical protein